jgi:hypothetical protein
MRASKVRRGDLPHWDNSRRAWIFSFERAGRHLRHYFSQQSVSIPTLLSAKEFESH